MKRKETGGWSYFQPRGSYRLKGALILMNKAEWKAKIEKSCADVGTYKQAFDSVIDTLADILERRDMAQEQFNADGYEILVEHTNQGGNTNIEQNPILRMINELNRDALAYWRDLGLTPAGLKRINDAEMAGKKKVSPLAQALKELG
jgi:hypothetical protein